MPPSTFYSKLFADRAGQAPARVRQLRHRRAAAQAGPHRGRRGTAARLNHLGVEVASTDEVVAAPGPPRAARASPTAIEDGVTCCYALQDGHGHVARVGADGQYSVMLQADCTPVVGRLMPGTLGEPRLRAATPPKSTWS